MADEAQKDAIVENDAQDWSDSPTQRSDNGAVLTNPEKSAEAIGTAATIAQQHHQSKPPQQPPAQQQHRVQPPNGGLWAWIQVASGFAIFFNTWGVLNTFGIFQTYYETGELFRESSSNIAWIGSIQAYCALLLGLVSGPIYDRGYFRHLLVAGSFLIVFGFMMLSICQSFWQALLAQGFCIGIGAGLLFVPSLAVLPAYFSTKLGLAVGMAASGSSLGGVIYPIVFYKLIGGVGFGWAVRTLGFVALATLLVPIFFMKMGVRPVKPRAILDWSALTSDWPFALFTLAAMIGFIGLYVMLFYTSYLALAAGIADSSMSFYLVPILNAASMFGRTLPNALSDKTGPINLLAPGAIICGILSFAMIGVKSLAGIVVVTLLYGFFSGVFIALPPVCFVRLTKDKSKVGTRLGMGYACLGFGVLAGGPGGGAILGTDQAHLHWTKLWVYGGCVAVGAGIMLTALRFSLTKGKLWIKI
ncbi:major facilitator superfamily domain-containing protein [Diplogelasinospora grovesii]|uniref:Major facilitator superfamily domain-containing protein n=1 Tax=Diplogelasinospora grovesii TaxID=303347 RepID=A0AAN6N6H6_9PEZI|nr:major facilitator superfamily domain-containing protein [Diplogelasinospora grovesii]